MGQFSRPVFVTDYNMNQWLLIGWRFLAKPISIAMIVGVLTAWYTTADYQLSLQWRKALVPGTGLFAQSSSGVCFLYTKDESRPRRYWFLGKEAHSPEIDLQVPEGAIFTGSHFFSDDGKWFAINGMYTQKSGSNSFFVFDTSTGRLVDAIPIGSSAEPACFSGKGDYVVFESNGLKCWDLKAHRLLPEVSHEPFFIVNWMVFAHHQDRLYCLGALYEGTQLELKPPESMQLRCWSIPEKREIFRVQVPLKQLPFPWGLVLDERDLHLFGVFETSDKQDEHHRDGDTICCWDSRDGRFIKSISKSSGEAGDPIFPMDGDHFLVFRDKQPNAIRYYWKKWLGNDPGWLKTFLPNRSYLDLRDMATGKTLQTMSMGFGHWPRFNTTHGTGLETYSSLNGTEELAFWRIESRNRYLDALLIGASVALGTWLLVVVSTRMLFRPKSHVIRSL